ncbi:hypothetical protein HYH03_001388 [Edaphochlamys debaryana]|uniref:SET domain-containing protein n=1 Tax=Edaphochlamys debaryana TaxID=47281 RepID=A0A836C4X0_9CHLO|nr:hypothetical protein HYH03_001388 [Edaphochlamys debaryana]|eukprot:KAG2500621.1 hypothetical protein HYH03_001388 [Edaphochlamys debaryana]
MNTDNLVLLPGMEGPDIDELRRALKASMMNCSAAADKPGRAGPAATTPRAAPGPNESNEPAPLRQHIAEQTELASLLTRHPGLAPGFAPVSRFCRLPLSALAPIALSDLRPGALHMGKYVICRTPATPFRLRAVFTVVQGLAGPQQRLSVYNLATDPAEISPGCSADVSSHLLPRGSVIAIKEPWLKRGSAGPMYGIRVDSPLDLLVLDDPNHPLVAGTAWAQLVAESPAGRRRAETAEAAGVAVGGGAGSGGESSSGGGEDGEGELAEADRVAAEAAARWHEEGNRLYGAGAHVDALACYREGLEALRPLLTRLGAGEGGPGADGAVQDPGSPRSPTTTSSGCSSSSSLLGSAILPQLLRRRLALLSNCAAACLGFGDPASALRWADRVLALQPAHPKALSRRSAALAGTGRYAEAAEAYRSFLAAAPPGPREAPSCRLHLSRLQQRRSEAEAGAYDEAGMAREAGRSAAPRLEAADFVGPVAMADMDAGGHTGTEAEAVAVSKEGNTQQGGAAAGEGVEAAGGQQRSRGRGRGLVTTRAVAAGELLLACKADAVCFLGEVQAPASAAAAPTAAPGYFDGGPSEAPRGPTHEQLDRDLAVAVLARARLALRLSHMAGAVGAGSGAGGGCEGVEVMPPLPSPACGYGTAVAAPPGAKCGGCEEADEDAGWGWLSESGLLKVSPEGLVSVDEAAVARITSLNAFSPIPLPELRAAPVAAASAPPHGMNKSGGGKSGSRSGKNGARASNVTGNGAAGDAGGARVGDAPGAGGEARYMQARGIWSLASYINHACIANAHRYFIGDFIFIRATTNIPASTEVTMPYIDALSPAHDRARTLAKYGFACACELCTEEAAWVEAHPDQSLELQGSLAEVAALQPGVDAAAAAAAAAAASRGLGGTSAAAVVAPVAARLQGLLTRLEAASQGLRWRLALVQPYGMLAFLLQAAGDEPGAASAYEQLYACLWRGGSGEGEGPCCSLAMATQLAMSLAVGYARAAGSGGPSGREASARARRWEAAARADWRRGFGGAGAQSDALFEARFGEPAALLRRLKGSSR